jgi:hypothetical protein
MLSQREKIILVNILGIEEDKSIRIVPRAAGDKNPRLVVSLIV